MGRVLAIFKIMPDDMEHYEEIREAIKEHIPEEAKLEEIREEPIAFGLKALVVGISMEDTGGILDKVEEALKQVPHVESVNLEGSTLI
ncbi:MAG: elongation factor 1-beta [Candidatus Diapherotrites archaeon]|nr:elongation factor 1-beta [Candidatus Diapherotrites archaeon]